IGIGLILVAVFGFPRFDAGLVYPGWWAVVPTFGTALLIWAGPQAFPNRSILARRAVVYLGLISYPLYLWHWPALAFVRITESGQPSIRLRAMAVALSFILAWLTYVLLERPLRRRVSARTPGRVFAIAALLIVVGAAAFTAVRTGAVTSRTPRF